MRTCHQLESRGLRPLDPGEGKVIGGVCVGLLVNLITIYHSASSAHPQGGGTQVPNVYGVHCQTAAQSGSGEGQNIGAVNSFEGKKEGGQLQTEHLVMVAFWKMCLFPLYFVKYMMLIIVHAL